MKPQDDINIRENEPMYWFNKSSDLRGAAGALDFCMENQKEHSISDSIGLGTDYDMIVGTYGVYRMLCGMSLELIYKAIIISKDQKYKPTHNLVKLGEAAGIPLNNDEIALLEILTQCVIWEGRYPTPNQKKADVLEYFTWLSYENLYEKVKVGDRSWMLKPKTPNPLDWDGFSKLWLKASESFFESVS